MKHFVTVALILLYVLLSAFLETEEGGRIVPADLFLLGLIFLAALSILTKRRMLIPPTHATFVPILALFLISAVFATFPDRASFEALVIAFSFVGSLAILNLMMTMPEDWLKRLMSGYALVIGGLSLVCLLDFLLFPGLIASRNLGGVQGPFRNTGQAGSFFGVHASLLLAMLLGRLLPAKPQYLISTALVIITLVLTFKRASILAVAAGFVFLSLFMSLSNSNREKKVGFLLLSGTAVFGSIGYLIFGWALDSVPGMRWRFEYKFSTDSIEQGATGFFAQNIKSAFQAFADRPFIGVGLDNVRGVYQSHEIHSTYLSILAYGGAIGVLTYIAFMLSVFHQIIIASRNKLKSSWSSFLYYFLPMLMGQMIGWGYTLHYRKREFWFLMAIVALAVMRSRGLAAAKPEFKKTEIAGAAA
jgi:hypothetical protein